MVSEMAEVTRIRQTYLNAIEEEKFEVFPSAVYLRGYLHCFIKTLDLPQEKVIRDYMKIYEDWIRRWTWFADAASGVRANQSRK